MLSDVKILDLSTLLPGPYASMILADLGALGYPIKFSMYPTKYQHAGGEIGADGRKTLTQLGFSSS
jgi:crotonobetainyl-CoA:carnitine CoA-transferase CaiB-like acyl-CoA transferase